jgi:hypothetical protein
MALNVLSKAALLNWIICFVTFPCSIVFPPCDEYNVGVNPFGLELRLFDIDPEPFSFDHTEWVVIHNQECPDLWLRKT